MYLIYIYIYNLDFHSGIFLRKNIVIYSLPGGGISKLGCSHHLSRFCVHRVKYGFSSRLPNSAGMVACTRGVYPSVLSFTIVFRRSSAGHVSLLWPCLFTKRTSTLYAGFLVVKTRSSCQTLQTGISVAQIL